MKLRSQKSVSKAVRKVVSYYLNPPKKPTLPFGVEYTAKEIEMLSKLPRRVWPDLFLPGNEYNRMIVTVVCDVCGSHRKQNDITKARFMKIMRGDRFTCDDCERRQLEESRKREAQSEANYSKKIDDFIYKYVNPKRVWNKDISMKDRWKHIHWPYESRDKRVKEAIKRLAYDEFLQTPYWKAVAWKVKQRAGFKCQMCNGKTELAAHHRSYEHHGQEHLHMNDLIALCGQCHTKFHKEAS